MIHLLKMRRCALSLVTLVVFPWAAFAQTGAEPPSIDVKVMSVTTKGKASTLKVADAAGNEFELQVTPKVELEIVAKGDDAFLAPGQVVKIDAIESNDYFFGSQFDVYPQYTGRALPAKAVKAPPKPGQSQNLHFISGEIVSLEDVPDGKYDLLHLKVNAKTNLTVYVEPQHSVRVILTDPASIKEGQAATIIGRASGPRILASKVSISTGETLKGEEFLATVEKKR